MSVFRNNAFDMIMNYPCKESPQEQNTGIVIELEEQPIHETNNNLKITSLKEAINIYKKIFSERIPKIDSKKEIYKYIISTMKKEDEMDLNDKYIFSIYIALNKQLLNKSIKKDILEEEFHLMLINWLLEEKKYVEIELLENNNINYFNIYIGLLINIISIFEILPIKSKDLFEFNFCAKLFKIYKFVKLNINLNINVSLSFLINKIENILKKWDNQIECYYLAKNIKNYNEKREQALLGKKIKRSNFDEEKDDTETDSSSDRGESNNDYKLGGLFNINKNKVINKNKKVSFDFDNNKKIFFDKDNKVSDLLINNF